jgi:hypothetical protein
MDRAGRKEGQRMSIHTGTIIGFLNDWGKRASVDDLGFVLGAILKCIAERGRTVQLVVDGQALTFSPETIGGMKDALRRLLVGRQRSGTS